MIFKRSVVVSALSAISVLAFVFAGSAVAQPVASPDDVQEPGRQAAVAQRKAEHERIHRERDAVKAKRQRDEAACYQRFAVEDCLRGVRAGVREAEGRLRTQEIELNDAERREKAAERLKSIEEKQAGAAPARPSAGGSSPDATLRKAPHEPESMKSQRDQEALHRAQQQRSRVQQQAQEQAARSSGSAQRAAQARSRHEQALKAAEERRARVEKSRAEAAAQGRKPAAPLPPASSAP